jgi:alkanesulfonate monooxygenase SsuD/methylene tetrahydromethanopterin reductase-like flavin-dependent oxidoreductase (luciferase family)
VGVAAEAELAQVAEALRAYRFRFADEGRLQDAIEGALRASGFTLEREVRLDPANRIDFMVGRVGIEVKVAGSPSAVLRQLTRYAQSGQVDGLILVTNRARHAQPRRIGVTPVEVVSLMEAGL